MGTLKTVDMVKFDLQKKNKKLFVYLTHISSKNTMPICTY